MGILGVEEEEEQEQGKAQCNLLAMYVIMDDTPHTHTHKQEPLGKE